MFALTEAIEISAIFLLSRRLHLAGFRTAAIAFVATLITHPFAWMANQALAPWLSNQSVESFWVLWATASLGIESFAILVEAAWYRVALPLETSTALAWSTSANAASFMAGLALYFSGLAA
jgi:hypothetical protein